MFLKRIVASWFLYVLGVGRPEWKGIGLICLNSMVIEGDEEGRGFQSHYKFAAILKEAFSPFGSGQIVIRQSTYIRLIF